MHSATLLSAMLKLCLVLCLVLLSISSATASTSTLWRTKADTEYKGAPKGGTASGGCQNRSGQEGATTNVDHVICGAVDATATTGSVVAVGGKGPVPHWAPLPYQGTDFVILAGTAITIGDSTVIAGGNIGIYYTVAAISGLPPTVAHPRTGGGGPLHATSSQQVSGKIYDKTTFNSGTAVNLARYYNAALGGPSFDSAPGNVGYWFTKSALADTPRSSVGGIKKDANVSLPGHVGVSVDMRDTNFLAIKLGMIGSHTFEKGVYRWEGFVSMHTDIYIYGNSEDEFIFQVTGYMNVAYATNIILVARPIVLKCADDSLPDQEDGLCASNTLKGADGANYTGAPYQPISQCGDGTLPKVDNIKWLVGGYLAVGAMATIKGTFMVGGYGSLGANVHVEGRLFTKTALTIGASAIVTCTGCDLDDDLVNGAFVI
jgi:hypothetical protein